MSSNNLDFDITIIGAGIIGLSIGEKLSKNYNTLIIEENEKFGQVTSSRNSEVIHSGIHYKENSFKTIWCIEGRKLLYEYCERKKIPFKKTGKLILATDENEEKEIFRIKDHSDKLGIPASIISQTEIKKKNPNLKAMSALFFPETGVFDSHSLMASLESTFLSQGGVIAYRHEAIQIEPQKDGWIVKVKHGDSEFRIFSKIVVNAAGLKAAALSNQALSQSKFEHRFCLGRYFGLKRANFNTLVYPVPNKDGLGIHITIDLSGQVRLGPDTEWVHESDVNRITSYYNCDWDVLYPKFLNAIRKLYSGIKNDDIAPQLVGIRPKLFINGFRYNDFLVENHNGFIHCLGIESPGLTASLACAEYVKNLVIEQLDNY